MTKHSPIFDGFINQMYPFMKFFDNYRLVVFDYGSLNLLANELTLKVKIFLSTEMKYKNGFLFYPSLRNYNLDLDRLKTELVYYKGIDPYLNIPYK